MGNGTETDCGLQSGLDPISIQQVEIGDWVRQLAMGEAWITVRDTRAPGVCFGQRLVAEGMGVIHNTDNDRYVSGNEGGMTWGFMGHGRLTSPDGSTVNYSGEARFLYVFATDSYKPVSLRVNIH